VIAWRTFSSFSGERALLGRGPQTTPGVGAGEQPDAGRLERGLVGASDAADGVDLPGLEAAGAYARLGQHLEHEPVQVRLAQFLPQ
jgi:hypothetical protein